LHGCYQNMHAIVGFYSPAGVRRDVARGGGVREIYMGDRQARVAVEDFNLKGLV
jgi:hypothetical protein